MLTSDSTDDAPQFRVAQDIELMRRYARLYKETRDLAEGAKIDLEWWWEDPAGTGDPTPVP
jgi:hypothetical protein